MPENYKRYLEIMSKINDEFDCECEQLNSESSDEEEDEYYE
jgi:hypothetical protein